MEKYANFLFYQCYLQIDTFTGQENLENWFFENMKKSVAFKVK